jgi:hypothetical protein
VVRKAVMAADPSLRLPEVPNPLTNPGKVVAWLRQPADSRHPAWLLRYLYHLHRERKGLVRAFPRVPGEDAHRFLDWVRRRGGSKAGVPEALMPSAEVAPSPGLSPRPVGEGVNGVGFLRAESGLGEATRQIVEAVQTLGVPLATVTYSPTNLRSRQEHSFTDRQPVPDLINPFDVNIVCVNAPEVPRFAIAMGPGLFSNRYTVGAWAWEFEEISPVWAADSTPWTKSG